MYLGCLLGTTLLGHSNKQKTKDCGECQEDPESQFSWSMGAWVELWPYPKLVLKGVPLCLHANQSLIRSCLGMEDDISGGYCSAKGDPLGCLGWVHTDLSPVSC